MKCNKCVIAKITISLLLLLNMMNKYLCVPKHTILYVLPNWQYFIHSATSYALNMLPGVG